ncbi:CHAT domain-containing protein [Suillus lakei]|nr:CHAT domain-containing protein [Suillus lakei]
MARQRIDLGSLGSSESDFCSASSPSPTPVEKISPSTEPLIGGKCECELSDNDNDGKPKGSKRPRSQKKDVTRDNEEPAHSTHPQDPGETNLSGVQQGRKRKRKSSDNDNDDKRRDQNVHDCNQRIPARTKEPSPPEHTRDPGEARLSGVQQVIITAHIDDFPQAIRATDLACGLRRIPAGFHVVVKADGTECQTSNKSVHVDQAVVEWNERILFIEKDSRPCEPSSKVRVSVYASFELSPMLCHGEVLRTFEISVGELLDRSEKSHPIVFQPKQEEVISPCTSLFATVEQRLSDENDTAVLCPLTTLMSSEMDALVLRTDAGHRLLARYRRTQNNRDLGQSINHFEHASDLCPMGNPYRPAALFNLATAKFVSCKADGRYLDLDLPISLFQDALDLRPTGHPDRTVTQIHLAISLLSRFAKRGFQTDDDEAKELLNEVLNVCHVDSHIHRAALLAIETSAPHPAGSTDANDPGQEWPAASMLPLSPNQLADLAERCMQGDDPGALDEVISLHYDALGNDEDLDQAIALQREALALRPIGHTDRSLSLNNLAAELSTRFSHRGNDEDLDQAIALHRDALALRPVGHTDRSSSLNNLVAELSTRFWHRGNDEDLDQAIALHREALALCLVGHTDRSSSLGNLATQLSTCFLHRGNDEDLDQAIALHREALALCPVGHADRSSSLNNLAAQLSIRFSHRGNDKDLDQAIALQREVLALRPVGHRDRSSPLNNLTNQLSTRFSHRGNDEDLDQAIALQREVLALCPVGHTDRSSSLNNLANQLSTRFSHQGNDEDLDQAIALHREALALQPVHKTLADVYLLFYRLGLDPSGNTDSLNAVMYHLKAAVNVVSGRLLSRLRASLLWVHHADQHAHGTQLEAYATSMQLLDAHMSATASVSSRHSAMKEFPRTLAVDAASCALHSGDICRSVELLEQGRTLIWTQMARLRMPLDNLQTCGDHAVTLMKRFRDLSSLLEKPPASHADETPKVDIEAEETQYRRLVEKWNRAVEEIQNIEGFSRFLLPPLFSDLQEAARDGPIIMLIASKSSCDAIIIPHSQPPTSIQLPTTLEKLRALAVKLQCASEQALKTVLMELWDEVVRPVVENLGGFAQPGSRIWWCPTSVFNSLPLHAAGEYSRKHGQLLSRLYISSYTPLLTALIKARKSLNRSLPVSFAAISQNLPNGYSHPLHGVEPELDLVQRLLTPLSSVSLTKITSNDATKSRALCTLRDNTWLHFACHGTQNLEEPFKLAFLMRDHPLSLLDITQMDLSRHEFIFLSACETAVGDPSTPDEVIHLAAGLQFAGVQSVVGTLWQVNDSTVGRLVNAFYRNLCGDGKMNSKCAAQALHRAVQSLASDEDIPLEQRIVFIHIGI